MQEMLIETGLGAIKHGESLGADEMEAYLQSISSIYVAVEDSKIKSVARKRDIGCSIRIIDSKRIGYSYATTADLSDVRNAVESAYNMARISTPDKDFIGLLSGPLSYPEVKNIHDPSIASLLPEEAIEIMKRSIRGNHDALEKTASPKVAGILEAREIKCAIVNSNGISCTTKSTRIELSIDSTIRVDGHHGSSWKDQSSTSLKDINPEEIGRVAGERAFGSLGAKTIDSGVMPVVLSPDSIGMIFNRGRPGSLVSALNALNVINRNSYLIDRVGDEIGSSILSIDDDSLMTGGLLSRPFDAEGTPSRKTDVIHEGVLKGYLHDTYTSQRLGVENTSNASRNSYTETPKIAASNLIVAADRGSEDDIIGEINYGLYCRFTVDCPNLLSGDLNAVVMEGNLIRNGEKDYAVQNTMFSINILELLKSITRVGGNPTQTNHGVFPSISIDSALVTSDK